MDLSARTNDDIDVEFLIWKPEGECPWSWVTWSCESHPASIRFNSGVDAQFDALPANHFKKNGKTIIVIHGWTENGRNDWNQKMKDEFFKKGRSNVVNMKMRVRVKHLVKNIIFAHSP